MGESLQRGGHGRAERWRLPPLRSPAVSAGNLAVLVACSKTGRASWAEFQRHEGTSGTYYAWAGNVPAVPDLEAVRRGDSGGASAATSGSASVPADLMWWREWSCGVCGANSTPVPGKASSRFWRCGVCAMLYCPGGYEAEGGGVWSVSCPGCGSRQAIREGEETGKIDEYGTSRGAGGAQRLGSGDAEGGARPLPRGGS